MIEKYVTDKRDIVVTGFDGVFGHTFCEVFRIVVEAGSLHSLRR